MRDEPIKTYTGATIAPRALTPEEKRIKELEAALDSVLYKLETIAEGVNGQRKLSNYEIWELCYTGDARQVLEAR
jgi:hypothetical protein